MVLQFIFSFYILFRLCYWNVIFVWMFVLKLPSVLYNFLKALLIKLITDLILMNGDCSTSKIKYKLIILNPDAFSSIFDRSKSASQPNFAPGESLEEDPDAGCPEMNFIGR